jgi:hypothetical protein
MIRFNVLPAQVEASAGSTCDVVVAAGLAAADGLAAMDGEATGTADAGVLGEALTAGDAAGAAVVGFGLAAVGAAVGAAGAAVQALNSKRLEPNTRLRNVRRGSPPAACSA